MKCGAKGAGIDCDEWRPDRAAEASAGKATCLHDLKRGQYKDVLRHFLQIAGHSARAFRVAQKSGQGHADREPPQRTPCQKEIFRRSLLIVEENAHGQHQPQIQDKHRDIEAGKRKEHAAPPWFCKRKLAITEWSI